MSGLRARVVRDVAELGDVHAAWDALAVACARPLSAPAWLLSWWETMAPDGARPRVVAVTDATGLIGVAPFYVCRRGIVQEYRLFGTGMANRNAPLAVPGRERDVARAVAGVLARVRPRPGVIALDQADRDSPWPALLAEAWPGRAATVMSDGSAPAPTLEIAGLDPDEWLAGKSSNFRQRLRRDARRLEARGARTHQIADVDELARAMDAFERLHGARWGDASQLTSAAGRELMLRAARRLLPDGRFRAVVIEDDERVVSVQFFVAAGGEVAYWNGGWDPEWAQLSPAIQGIVAGVQDAMRRGDRRIDFGQGDHHYKLRLADGDHPVAWPRVYPRTPAAVPARALALAGRLRARVGVHGRRLSSALRRRSDQTPGDGSA